LISAQIALSAPAGSVYNQTGISGEHDNFLEAAVASEGSVTQWLDLLKGGDPVAAQRLWERYFQSLVRLARKKLQGAAPRGVDEEDVALSAFDSFCRGAEAGRFPRLDDRDNLWRLLVVLTAHKISKLLRDERRLKRGGKLLALPLSAGSDSHATGLQQVLSREPTPQFAAQVAEEYQRLLARLGDRELEAVALWKMEGYTNGEIAAKLDYTVRTVERKLRIIRGLWQQEDSS
jgi:DNA-directed RNA polymerase specialized sigma24 family protein